MMKFLPQLHILPEPQRLLWQELHAVPSSFILYGGTAIALHLGHRESVDFDFFSFQDLDTLALYFDEGDVKKLPQSLKERIIKAVEKVDLSNLPSIQRENEMP
jgi:hypothetical protein